MENDLQLDVDYLSVQARQQGAQADIQNLPVPPTAFVGSLNGQTGNITLGAGSVPVGTITFTNGVGTVSINLVGLDPMAAKKSNLVAAADPAVGDDSSQGYAEGSFWLNTVTPSFWVAASVAVGAAVWLKLSP